LATALVVVPGGGAGQRWRAVLCGRQRDSRTPVRSARADPLAAAAAFDLLAACLRAGLPLAVAARVVAPTSPGTLGAALGRVADLLALGADPATVWRRIARDAADADIQALARLAGRSARSGTALASALAELAGRCRDGVEDAAAARAERAGVLIGGPLGLCFLPAFVCLGIVPVVMGLAFHVLGGGL
jgi:pilus assembly protein TadC